MLKLTEASIVNHALHLCLEIESVDAFRPPEMNVKWGHWSMHGQTKMDTIRLLRTLHALNMMGNSHDNSY